jgi:Fur family ferric uptake transcriptional regulator
MIPKDILHSHNLKRTSCREGILEVVMNSDEALSENEIREKLAGNFDRSTFYRSFKTLEDAKIIHRIVVDNHLVKYALDNTITRKGKHAHFYCRECNTVKCMEGFPVLKYKLPEGYLEDETEVLIKGRCASCKN